MASQENKEAPNERLVIVRGWGDEPAKLNLYAIDSKLNRAIVGKTDTAPTISLPMEYVFEFDQQVFTRLLVAYESGDMIALAELYTNETRKVICDQEPLSDPECAAGRGRQ